MVKKTALTLIILLTFSSPVFARPDIKIDLSSKKVVTEKGKEILSDAKDAKPGDILIYTLKVMNKGDSPAKSLAPKGDIPANTIYVPETHESKEYKVLYSIDEGSTYQEIPTIKIKENGKQVVKKAPVEMYKKIKWVFSRELASKKSIELTYKVKIK